MKIFDVCSLRAQFNWVGDKCSIEGTDISFLYQIETHQEQGILIFCIYIINSSNVSMFSFSYIIKDDSLGISIYNNHDDLVHSSEIKNVDEFEARLFQIQTITDTYDLSTNMYQTMRDLHRIYFREKYETVQTNVV